MTLTLSTIKYFIDSKVDIVMARTTLVLKTVLRNVPNVMKTYQTIRAIKNGSIFNVILN